MATSAAEARQKARERAAAITQIVATHQKVDVSEISNWTKLGDEAVFIIADVEEALDCYLTSAAKQALYGSDVVALIAAFGDPA